MSNGILKVIDALDERIRVHHESFYVTAQGDKSLGTFSDDNWEHFRRFAAMQTHVSFVIRRFEPGVTQGKIPLKSICGVYASKEGDVALATAEMTKGSMHTDAGTGRPLPPLDEFVRYVDARVILPGLHGRIMGDL